MNALELHGLEKHYPDFTLGPIDLELPGGTVCGLIGENGAGKSTTIKLILDMIDGDAGTVKLFGQEGITPLAKADIGVVLGGEGIPTCLTTPQVGKVMAGIYTNWDAAAYADYCKRFELPEKKRYADYSTGMKTVPLVPCRGTFSSPQAAAVGRSHQRPGPGGAGRAHRSAAGLCAG